MTGTEPRPIRVMIVEDEEPARQTVRSLLEEDPEVVVVGETWGRASVAAIEEAEPDLVFLDVRMPHMDGFDVLRELELDPLPEVVFVTAHGEHAVDAFEVRAIDYVLKPFTDRRFREALTRAKERVRRKGRDELRDRLLSVIRRDRAAGDAGFELGGPDRIVLRDGSSTVVLPPSRIEWIEASGPYVVIHAEGREYLVRTSLGSMEERLEARGFFRVHRSAVVSLEYVREVEPLSHGDGLITLRGGTKVKLSRSRREGFEKALAGG